MGHVQDLVVGLIPAEAEPPESFGSRDVGHWMFVLAVRESEVRGHSNRDNKLIINQPTSITRPSLLAPSPAIPPHLFTSSPLTHPPFTFLPLYVSP